MNNVAIVGLGGMGLRHCEAISQLKNVNLTSICDIDINRVKETSNKYGVESGYTDWKEMITTESIDLRMKLNWLYITLEDGLNHMKD